MKLIYIPYSTLSRPPASFGKSWSLTILFKKNYIENFRIRNYFTKDFLNFSFHYVQYCNHLVTFWKNFLISLLFFKLSMNLARAMSFSSSSVLSDHLESIAFSSFQDLFLISKLNINWLLLFFIVFL